MNMSCDMKRDFCWFEKINRPLNQEWEEKLVLRKTQLSEVRIQLKNFTVFSSNFALQKLNNQNRNNFDNSCRWSEIQLDL